MTLKTLYSKLGKIIDEKSKTDPDILDKPVCLSVLPIYDLTYDLVRCGTYGIVAVEEEENTIIIANHNL